MTTEKCGAWDFITTWRAVEIAVAESKTVSREGVITRMIRESGGWSRLMEIEARACVNNAVRTGMLKEIGEWCLEPTFRCFARGKEPAPDGKQK